MGLSHADTCVPWGGHKRVEYVSAVKIIKGGKDIIPDGLSWVGIEFFVCGGVV